MTRLILAVVVRVALILIAEMTGRDDVVTDSFSKPLIEHEVLSVEFVWKTLLINLSLIVDDAALQMLHVLVSIVLQPCTRFLTPNPSRTVDRYFFVLTQRSAQSTLDIRFSPLFDVLSSPIRSLRRFLGFLQGSHNCTCDNQNAEQCGNLCILSNIIRTLSIGIALFRDKADL